MNFWTTGRIDEKIMFEDFQPAMLEVERDINAAIKDRSYGGELDSFDMVVNIFERRPQEFFRYSPKKRETTIDVNIDHDGFLAADPRRRCALYLEAVLRAIDGIRGNKNLKKFNFDGLRADIAALAGKYSS